MTDVLTGGLTSLSDSQSRQLIREALHTNLLVEAGAGSGKTQMLAERMAAGVASGAYQVERMAAVTFTRKAAAELRGRFHVAMEEHLRTVRQLPPSRERTDTIGRLESALNNLERFFAGTIHSFCARLLREHPVESGVSPGFTELNEVQEQELRKRAWRDFIAESQAAGDPRITALLEADVRPKFLDAAFATICLHEDVEFPPGNGQCPDPTEAVAALQAFWRILGPRLPEHIDPKTKCEIQQAAQQFPGAYHVARHRLNRPAVVASLLSIWKCKPRITMTWWEDITKDTRRLRQQIEELHKPFLDHIVNPYLAQWRQYVYRIAIELLTDAREHAKRERRRQNVLNYGDLLLLTATVLRTNAMVRRALQETYKHLFVDEFQDTDPVQAEIAFLLAADESPGDRTRLGGPVDWRTVPLRPGALFVVGDPKQSIYRFRRADIDIYNIVRARLGDPSCGHVLPLTKNFRSIPRLCNWANRVFETRFPAQPDAHRPRFAPLEPRPDSLDEGGVFVLTHSGDRRDVAGQDADRIAAFIRSEVDEGRRHFKDFLILTRKRKSTVPYMRALEALNIPLEVSGAGAFGDSREVVALTALLRALSDPDDQLALLAVLRGPLFGISDRQLFAFRESGGWFGLFGKQSEGAPEPGETGADGEGDPDPGAVQVALNALRRYHRWTRLLPASAAIDRILEDSGYLALAATTAGGTEAGDLLHAIDRVRQVVEVGGNLADAAEALADDADEGGEVESLPLEPGRSDVVRVMNLHKAKGLEADVVFLADPMGGFSPRIDVHIERRGNVAHGWFRLEKKSEAGFAYTVLGEHADWPEHESAERPYLEAEEDRLLYVAATRARQVLVVSRWTGNQKVRAWGVLNSFLDDATELQVPADVRVALPQVLTCSDDEQHYAEQSRAARRDIAITPSWAITSPTGEAKHVARIVRAHDTPEPAEDDPTAVVATQTPTHRADAGAAWGTLIHGLLEHAMRYRDVNRDDLRRLAMWLTLEEPQLRNSLETALDTVAQVAKAEFWRTAKSGEHLEEVPFATMAGTTVTTGVIDLLFRQGEQWRLIDYKTDVALDASGYQGQLTAYRKSLKLLNLDLADAELFQVRQTR
jgi:ATP-dependent helicase/nuclease subunit A